MALNHRASNIISNYFQYDFYPLNKVSQLSHWIHTNSKKRRFVARKANAFAVVFVTFLSLLVSRVAPNSANTA
jgi:lipopolysaccharide export LptBFGC system permease protein LptF